MHSDIFAKEYISWVKSGYIIVPVKIACSSVTHTRTCLTALYPRIPGNSRYQKGKTNLDFTDARDSEWQWHQLGHMQVCNSLWTDNHASTSPLSFLQAGCPSCRPTNSVNALKAKCSSVTKFETYFIHCAFYAALLVINTKQVQYVPPHYGRVNLCSQHFTLQQQL